MYNSFLKDGFTHFNINVSQKQIDKFLTFYKFVFNNNKKFNLTRILNKKDFIIKHIFDSVSLFRYIHNDNSRLLDIGSGGGFPGIPLKIIVPKLDLYLLDSSIKKCNFLLSLIHELKLKNVQVINDRIESLHIHNPAYFNFFDFTTSRAFSHLGIVSEVSLPYLKIGGMILCQKSNKQSNEILESEEFIKSIGGSILKVDDITLPKSKIERKVIIIKKAKPTPLGIPRTMKKMKRSLHK